MEDFLNSEEGERNQKAKSKTDKQKSSVFLNRIPRRISRKRKLESEKNENPKRSKKEETYASERFQEQESSFFDESPWIEPELDEVFNSEIQQQTNFISPRKRATLNRSETPSSSVDSSSRPESSQSGSVRTRSRRRNAT